MKHKYCKCAKCGFVAFAVSKKYAEDEIAFFNAWYDKQSKEVQKSLGRKSSLANYTCQLCGGSKFVAARRFELPYGSTISPVVWEKKKCKKKKHNK